MRNVKLLIPAVTLAALSSLPLAAQQPGQPTPDTTQPNTTQPNTTQPDTRQSAPAQSDPQAQPTQPSGATPVPSTANAPEVNNANLRPVNGELVSKLDTKDAKNGDPIVVKTTEKATIGNGVVIPKGSKITGHITDVTAHDGTNQNSKVAIQFDQAELKGGQTMPIKSVLQSIEPAAGSDSAQTSPFNTGSAPSAPPASGSSAPSSSAPSGSGSPSYNSAPPQTSSAPSSQGAAPAAGGYPSAGTVVARQGNIEIKTTAIPGVLIAGNSNGQPFANASGALLGARQNVHLDGGTKVTLAIADANAHASNIR